MVATRADQQIRAWLVCRQLAESRPAIGHPGHAMSILQVAMTCCSTMQHCWSRLRWDSPTAIRVVHFLVSVEGAAGANTRRRRIQGRPACWISSRCWFAAPPAASPASAEAAAALSIGTEAAAAAAFGAGAGSAAESDCRSLWPSVKLEQLKTTLASGSRRICRVPFMRHSARYIPASQPDMFKQS